MASLIDKLKQILGDSHRIPPSAEVVLDAGKLEHLMHILSDTREDELSCEDVATRLDEYVDCLSGRFAESDFVALMEHHLAMCSDCHEAFDALMRAIAASEGDAHTTG